MEDKMFSENQIEQIIKKVSVALRHNQINIHKDRLLGFETALRGYLKETGVIENVCPACLGTGKKLLSDGG
jgi:hypothetical protein